MTLPRLYPIADRSCFADSPALYRFVEELLAAGITLIQYRNKQGNAREILQEARELRRIASSFVPTLPTTVRVGHPRLIMNDRADLALAAGFDGVHVGQDDLSPQAVRNIIGPDLWLGVSTHNSEQLVLADKSDADYLAIGPVYETGSKANPDPIVGLDGVRRARMLTRKPMVAIGGIMVKNARDVIEAGADSVAVISALVDAPRERAAEFLRAITLSASF